MALELCFCYTLSYDLIDFLAALWVDVKQLKRPKQHLCDSSVKQPYCVLVLLCHRSIIGRLPLAPCRSEALP